MEESSILLIKVVDRATSVEIIETIYLPALPKEMPGLKTILPSISVDSIKASGNMVEIELSSDHLALFVVLTTRAQGRFSKNALALRPNQPKVSNMFDKSIISFQDPHNTTISHPL